MSSEMQDAADSAPVTSSPGILSVLWRRKAYLVFGAVVSLGLGYLDYLRRERAYQSTAQLYVQKRLPTVRPPISAGGWPGGDSGVAFFDDFLATQEALIRSNEVLVLAGRHLQKQPPLEKPPVGDDYAGYIAAGLAVSRVQTGTGTSANILNIAFRGPSSADCEAVINAVIAAYSDSLQGGIDTAREGDLTQIEKTKKQTEKDLEEVGIKLRDVRDEMLELSPTPLADLKARIALHESKKYDLELRKIEIANRLKRVDEARANKKDHLALLALLYRPAERAADRPEARPADDALAALRLQEGELLESFGKDNPQVIAVKKRIALLSRSAPAGAGVVGESQVDFLVQAARQEVDAITLQTAFLDGLMEADRAVAKKLEKHNFTEPDLATRQLSLRKQSGDLDERRRQIELMKQSALFEARTINPAVAGVKVYPVLLQCLMLAGALGLAGGGGLAYLAELTDKSFQSPDDIRQRLGLAVVGHIPALTVLKQGEGLAGDVDPRVVVYHRPKSNEAEAYRGVRTAIYFSTRGKGHQVIQVTSPTPGDGKSTLSANLAVAIAQSGKRVVLIDCDFRKPRVHKIFGVSPDLGLASVIAGDADLAQATQQSVVPGLSLLPCGPRPANPAELLTSTRFQEVLTEIKGLYDIVLIDTPPMLAVSDPAVVAPRVDGVLLTVRITKKTRPAAERAKEILAALGANIIGVVVNDLQTGKGAGGYGYGSNYGYGYGYGYKYSYNYSYAEQYGDAADASGEIPALANAPGASGVQTLPGPRS